jgi:hypothetical protein
MHCFEGHHVTTLGEITNNCGSHHVQVFSPLAAYLRIFPIYLEIIISLPWGPKLLWILFPFMILNISAGCQITGTFVQGRVAYFFLNKKLRFFLLK